MKLIQGFSNPIYWSNSTFKGLFSFLSKDSSIMVIRPSDRAYNHLTYFEEKKYEEIKLNFLTPKLPRLSRFTDFKFEENILE